MKPYYQADQITIYHGDCREVMPQLPPATEIEVLITDPPYASAAATATTGWAKQKWGGNWGDMSLMTLMCETTLDAVPFHTEHEIYWFTDHLGYAALVPTFFRRYPLVQSVVWDRGQLGMGAYYRKQTEFIVYARTRGAPTFVNTSARDLIALSPEYAAREHPSQKPVSLVRQLLSNSGAVTVLDPYMGSGTTLIAAKRLRRVAIGIEIEERYCEIAARRLSQETLEISA